MHLILTIKQLQNRYCSYYSETQLITKSGMNAMQSVCVLVIVLCSFQWTLSEGKIKQLVCLLVTKIVLFSKV